MQKDQFPGAAFSGDWSFCMIMKKRLSRQSKGGTVRIVTINSVKIP